MTKTTETVFQKYQVRKTKKQKSAFIGYVKTVAEENGYTCEIQKGALGARNIVVGSPEKAKVIYTAHYDTCAVLPFPNFITPKNFLLYLLYQIGILIPLFAFIGVFSFLSQLLISLLPLDPALSSFISLLIYEVGLIGFCVLLIAGPANRYTANDNTSGITTLLDIMTEMPEELRGKAAFVFFDLEESGLFGSMSFANKYKKAVKNKPLINFDCVSDGDYILFAVRKTASRYASLLNEAFPKDSRVSEVDICSKGVFYPSDQVNFKDGIGVASLKRTKKGLLYMNRIHTPRDTVYREENIRFLTEGAIRLTQMLAK
ncbi:MAG: Zn-dependent exopeptidase M28 [Ruminococcaceae bacterium]|nr:Zn-dependent exopeptidase M28 [Oscillospiraceae bacterium]